MRDLHMHTQLGVRPKPRCKAMTIVRGATSIFKLLFTNKIYTFEDIKQVTFLFKQGTKIQKFTAIDYYNKTDWAFDPHFTYDEVTDTLTFMLSALETVSFFEPTELHDLQVSFEIAVELNNNTAELEGATILEAQPILYVLDSIYSQTIENENQGLSTASVVSENTFCSDDLICRN